MCGRWDDPSMHDLDPATWRSVDAGRYPASTEPPVARSVASWRDVNDIPVSLRQPSDDVERDRQPVTG